MTPEEMDRKIAEHLGWKFNPRWSRNEESSERWCESPDGKRIFASRLPAYSKSLDAMRYAEQALFTRHHDARDIFIDRLCRIMDPVNGYWKQSAADIIDATAEQHARAFVETIKQIKP